MARTSDEIQNMALFCDFENVALGVEEARYKQFDIGLVLERLLLKGSIVVKKAYCDWQRYKEFKAAMHQASFELIEIPHVRQSGKNSADIRMVVDALDLCYTKSHVDTFVIISGDSDFSPLVSKLRENNKSVIGVGVKKSTSDLLIANCDEFIFYDDLVRTLEKPPTRRAPAKTAKPASADAGAEGGTDTSVETGTRTASAPGSRGIAAKGAKRPAVPGARTRARKDADVAKSAQGSAAPPAADGAAPVASAAPEVEPVEPEAPGGDDGERRLREAMDLIVSTSEALLAERDQGDKIWGSMVKQTLKRRNPGFSESYYGFRSFSGMLEEAQARGLLALDLDEKSGGYVVRLAS